jgi:hypothetical protein
MTSYFARDKGLVTRGACQNPISTVNSQKHVCMCINQYKEKIF